MTSDGKDTDRKRAVLGHAKDTSLSLVQAAALLLTISLGLVTATATAESFREIRKIVVSSSIVLGASILAGVLTLSAVLDLMEGTKYEDWREGLARWLSAVQTWLFLAGMGLLISAIYTKLF